MYIDRIDDGTLALRDERGKVGWLLRGTLGFGGFHSALDAVQGALVAHIAAHAHLRAYGAWAPHGALGRSLTTSCEGGRTWIRVGGSPVALLLPPHGSSRAGPSSFAFELILPAHLPETASIALARVVIRALQRAGCARTTGEGRAAGEAPPARPELVEVGR